jgi:phage protein U
MLMQLGEVTFEVIPFNTDQYSRDAAYDFAAHDVMGRMRPREAMGEGDETWSISGKLFPGHFGGLGSLDTLNKMRAGGSAQPLVRGDGRNLGWFLIESVSERSSWLRKDGVGGQIEFDISLVKSPKPSAASMIQTLMRLFI